ncbi:MAG TPA: histidine--tRNA ligase [Candidatus Saccharimonadales bacterium]|nr:histidine--tRNA ligase [Candidatus Saccharimonadales bacterium]
MPLSTKAYKGARDFYPEDMRVRKYMFAVLRRVVESFGYQEYDAPFLEAFELYAAKTGDEIVNEQLYSFTDKGGRKVAIRPEMTPSVSRMVAGRRQELAYPLRWYSIPNLWRYERPQRGRLREHYQLNVDLFGEAGISADFEIILVADKILKAFGAGPDMYEIKLNSRKAMDGSLKSLELSEDQVSSLVKLIDKKSKMESSDFTSAVAEQIGQPKAEQLSSYLEGKMPPEPVERLLNLLNNSGVNNAVYDPSVVRGFDYYSDIVFEVYDKNPDNNRSMFGGGRYDGLVGLFGVEPVPTVGFGMGDVTLRNFLEGHNLLPELKTETDVAVILIGDVFIKAQPVIESLRAGGLNLAVDSTGRKLDVQLKHAVKAGAPFVIFIGEQELAEGQYKLRDLAKSEETKLPADKILEAIKRA